MNFFRSKLFKFLLPLLAYLLFAFQWIYSYASVWYKNVPEETQYLKGNTMGFYMGYAYIFAISFLVFLGLGLVHLLQKQPSKLVRIVLIVDLFLSSYYVWHHSTILGSWNKNGFLSYIVLVLIGVSIHLYSREAAEGKGD